MGYFSTMAIDEDVNANNHSFQCPAWQLEWRITDLIDRLYEIRNGTIGIAALYTGCRFSTDEILTIPTEYLFREEDINKALRIVRSQLSMISVRESDPPINDMAKAATENTEAIYALFDYHGIPLYQHNPDLPHLSAA